jgi:hypothetical protein
MAHFPEAGQGHIHPAFQADMPLSGQERTAAYHAAAGEQKVECCSESFPDKIKHPCKKWIFLQGELKKEKMFLK